MLQSTTAPTQHRHMRPEHTMHLRCIDVKVALETTAVGVLLRGLTRTHVSQVYATVAKRVPM